MSSNKLNHCVVIAALLLIAMPALSQLPSSQPQHSIQRLDDAAALMQQAIASRQPYPVLSQRGGEPFSLWQAYQVQQAVVADHQVFGFKAGLTTVAGQQKFSLAEPIGGVLLTAPRVYKGSALAVDSRQYNRLMIELELGFVLKHAIEKPILTIDELKQQVAFVRPVIELPDLGFEQTAHLRGVDIIAANAAAHSVLVGVAGPPLALDLNRLKVALYKNDELIMAGQGSDAMASQWQALQWLLNHSLKQGYPLRAGQLLITGALGGMLPAGSGDYRATFAELGEIHFKVR